MSPSTNITHELQQFLKKSTKPLTETELNECRYSLIQKSKPYPGFDPSSSIPFVAHLVLTACNPAISHSHRALATDTLSAWLNRSRFSPPLRHPFPAAFKYVCDVFFRYFDDATPGLSKALKDLLANVYSLAAKMEAVQEVGIGLAKRGLTGVSVGEGRKGGYYALDLALRKGVSARWVCEYAGGEGKLVGEMLSNLVDRNLGSAIGKAVVALLVTRRKELLREGETEADWLKIWAGPIKRVLQSEELRPRVVNYVLPGILKLSAECFRMFVLDLGLDAGGNIRNDADLNLGVLLCCLKVGKELGFVRDIGDEDVPSNAAKAPAVRLQSDLVAPLLTHALPDIRVAAVNLVVQSSSITRPLAPGVLTVLKTAIPHLHAESDAEVRDLLIGAIRHLIERVAASSYSAEKELRSVQQKMRSGYSPSPEDIRKIIQLDSRVSGAKDFCEWYVKLLEKSLRPGSNYQRTITALRVLGFLVRSGMDASLVDRVFIALPGNGSIASNGEPFKKGLFKWPEFSRGMNIFRPGINRVLLEAMFNPFDDVRRISAELLLLNPKWDKASIVPFLERGLNAMNGSGRARDSDGFARAMALIFKLSTRNDITFEEGDAIWGFKISSDKSGLGVVRWILDVLEDEYLGVAAADLQRAVKERPLHGFYEAIFLILELHGATEENATAWKEVHERIITSCEETWRLTKAPLCLDSPEGHVPTDFDEEDEDLGTQTVMSYSWRAVKGSSSLLGVVLGRAPLSSLSPTDLERGGKLLLQQLANIRHRGAFLSVSPPFVALCTRCFNSSDQKLQGLPRSWLRTNLDLIMEKSNAITRRSAGLPYLIMGVFASEIDPARPLLSSTFDRFVEIASMPPSPSNGGEKLDLPQVHALNSLKLLFTDARMSQVVVPFVGKGLELAVSCFGSDVWAIRNCGVMLFTALTNKLFGLRKSRNDYTSGITTRSFFEKFAGVRAVLLQNLRTKVDQLESGDTASVEMVYPALSLIARMEVDPGYEDMHDFLGPIMQCMHSRIWKVREMAARALAALISSNDVVDTITRLMQTGIKKQNRLHGNLCAVRVLLSRRVGQAVLETTEGHLVWKRISLVFANRFDELIEKNPCAVTKAAMLQLLASNAGVLDLDSGITLCIKRYLLSHPALGKPSVVGGTLLKRHLVEFTLTFKPDEATDLLGNGDEEILLETIKNLRILPALPSHLVKRVWELALNHPWNLLRAAALSVLGQYPTSPDFETDFGVLLGLVRKPPVEPIKEAALALLGPLVRECAPAESRRHALHMLLLELAKASHEDETVVARNAALASLAGLVPLIRLEQAEESLLPAFTLIYDLLNDDDDDIRLSAAKVAQGVLGSDFPMLPPAAAEKLALALPAHFPTSTTLLRIAIAVITGGIPARDAWNEAATKSTVLFEKEKQNLWIDIVGVVEVWGVVAELVLGHGVGKEEVGGLREWVTEAKLLVYKKEMPEGSIEVAGGWGREEKIFEFLARVRVAMRVIGME